MSVLSLRPWMSQWVFLVFVIDVKSIVKPLLVVFYCYWFWQSKKKNSSARSVILAEAGAWFHCVFTEQVNLFAFSDTQVTLDDKSNFKSLLSSRHLDIQSFWGKAFRSLGSYFVQSTANREQRKGGHIQTNASLIVFAVFLTGRLSWHNEISYFEMNLINKNRVYNTELCEATTGRTADLPNH